MGLINKKKDFTPFDLKRKPIKQPLIFLTLLWGAARAATAGMKVTKIRMEGLKPPFLVYSTHQGFSDYFIVPRMLFPHNCNYVSDMEGFAAFGNGPYRAGGCIGKRRYVPDVAVLANVRYALQKLKQGVVIFPESRHCDAGITSRMPKNLGRFVHNREGFLLTLDRCVTELEFAVEELGRVSEARSRAVAAGKI